MSKIIAINKAKLILVYKKYYFVLSISYLLLQQLLTQFIDSINELHLSGSMLSSIKISLPKAHVVIIWFIFSHMITLFNECLLLHGFLLYVKGTIATAH